MPSAEPRSAGPLEGIQVLDLSRHLPGPYCSMILADLGADVIKVEEPGTGDPVRWVPPRLHHESTLFLTLNRGKRSITLDFRRPEGRNVLVRLARRCDVLLETFRPGVMEKLGLSYYELSSRNPRIIYCSLTGFGQDGPRKAGHDIGYQALSGLLSIVGDSPQMPGLQVADLAGGALQAIIAILAALHARNKTRIGQYVDVSMLEGALSLQAYALSAMMGGSEPGAPTDLTGALACYRVYRTRDGRHVTLAALEPKFWGSFCDAAGRPDLIRRQLERGAPAQELIGVVQGIFAERTLAQWMELATTGDVCIEPVLNLPEALSQPVVKERGYARSVAHEHEGDVLQLPFAPRFSATPVTLRRPAPALGEHTCEILDELGYSAREQAELARCGTTHPPSSALALALELFRSFGWTFGQPIVRWIVARQERRRRQGR